MALEWLNAFRHARKKSRDYARKTLAAYALGMKAHGSIRGVVIERGATCCDAARALPTGILRPQDAPQLPLPGCPLGERCQCVYRPVMTYEQEPER